MVFQPLVTLFILHDGEITMVPEGIRRCKFTSYGEGGTGAGVDRVVNGRPPEGDIEVEIVGGPVGHDEVGPVLEVVAGVVDRSGEGEIVIRPRKTLAQAEGDAKDVNVLVRINVIGIVRAVGR